MDPEGTAIIEQRLTDMKQVSTGSVRTSNFNNAISNPSFLKMHDWILLGTPYGESPLRAARMYLLHVNECITFPFRWPGKYALYGLIHERYQEALYQLFDSTALMWRKVHTHEELADLSIFVAESLAKIEQCFPISEADVKLHNWIHLVDRLRDVGPCHTTSMFPYERLYGFLKHSIKSMRYPESNILFTFIKYQQSLLYQSAVTYTRNKTVSDDDLEILPEETADDPLYKQPDYAR
jgi:hypothetical protein